MRKIPLPTPAVLAIVARQGRLLLARRANPPDTGYWGFPGGHIESGETLLNAAVRELREETGVIAKAGHVLTAVDALKFDDEGLRYHFVLVAVICHWLEGEELSSQMKLVNPKFSLREWFIVLSGSVLGISTIPEH